jgi:hypothetical protein
MWYDYFMPFCTKHNNRWFNDKIGGCPGCEGKSLPTDKSLEAQWDFATSADIHTRNSVWYKYSHACWEGNKDRIELIEKSMRATIAAHTLGLRNVRKAD